MIRTLVVIGVTLLLLGCAGVRIDHVDEEVVEITTDEDCDWVFFKADYWYAPITAMTSTAIIVGPDVHRSSKFVIKGRFEKNMKVRARLGMYELSLFADKWYPQDNAKGVIPGSIRSIDFGSGEAPSPFIWNWDNWEYGTIIKDGNDGSKFHNLLKVIR